MGSDSKQAFAEDGEGPVREVVVPPFLISTTAVTNAQFSEFVRSTGYVAEAERFGWSFVFRNFLPQGYDGAAVDVTPWWIRAEGASWSRPEGPGSSTRNRENDPVVHVSWNDAHAFCAWAGYRLPTEAEWEFAARGGLEQKAYPWGDELTPGGVHMCNVWQGPFPDLDLGEDGYRGTAPVDAFPANRFGLRNAVGNVWEWCYDYFESSRNPETTTDPAGPDAGTRRVMKGGSYLCHKSYCFRHRNAARGSNSAESATGNIGFRVARDL